MNLDRDAISKLQEANRWDLIVAMYINDSGYAGIMPDNGRIVDRRIYPEAIPVQENSMMGIPPPKNPEDADYIMPWKAVKDFVNSLDEEQLTKNAFILISDNSSGTAIKGHFIIEDDIYVNDEDNEDCGTLEELKLLHGDDFENYQYNLATRKGTPFLWGE